MTTYLQCADCLTTWDAATPAVARVVANHLIAVHGRFPNAEEAFRLGIERDAE